MDCEGSLSVVPVVLCGGSGTRLWPLSRQAHPKQFLPLAGAQSLLQQAVQRLDVGGARPPVLVCHADHRFTVGEQMRAMGQTGATILLEPAGRNTAPAVALAALFALESDKEAVLVVAPSDHVVPDGASFRAALDEAIELARRDRLVVFGVRPTRAETGYGYIHAGAPSAPGYRVSAFVEKPDVATASAYVQSGEYLWNAGFFVFKARVFLEELARFRPATHAACLVAYATRTPDLDFERLAPETYEAIPSESVDKAVMEHTSRASVVPLEAGWSDVGSWGSLWRTLPQDDSQNVLAGDVVALDSRGCLVHSSSRLVAVQGLDALVVVETPDAVYVAPRDDTEGLGRLLDELRSAGRTEVGSHRRVLRPWGAYEALAQGGRYQVKRITVEPGRSLSLQRHAHRAEHWVVVRGTASIVRGDGAMVLMEDQSTYIPLGEIHRLENPGPGLLEIIEIQSGDYLGEDDIERLDDRYGRADASKSEHSAE